MSFLLEEGDRKFYNRKIIILQYDSCNILSLRIHFILILLIVLYPLFERQLFEKRARIELRVPRANSNILYPTFFTVTPNPFHRALLEEEQKFQFTTIAKSRRSRVAEPRRFFIFHWYSMKYVARTEEVGLRQPFFPLQPFFFLFSVFSFSSFFTHPSLSSIYRSHLSSVQHV